MTFYSFGTEFSRQSLKFFTITFGMCRQLNLETWHIFWKNLKLEPSLSSATQTNLFESLQMWFWWQKLIAAVLYKTKSTVNKYTSLNQTEITIRISTYLSTKLNVEKSFLLMKSNFCYQLIKITETSDWNFYKWMKSNAERRRHKSKVIIKSVKSYSISNCKYIYWFCFLNI